MRIFRYIAAVFLGLMALSGFAAAIREIGAVTVWTEADVFAVVIDTLIPAAIGWGAYACWPKKERERVETSAPVGEAIPEHQQPPTQDSTTWLTGKRRNALVLGVVVVVVAAVAFGIGFWAKSIRDDQHAGVGFFAPGADSGGGVQAISLDESLPRLRQGAPGLAGYSDEEVIDGAAVLCADLVVGKPIRSILRYELDNIDGITIGDAGVYLGFAVVTYCPEHGDKLMAWITAHH